MSLLRHAVGIIPPSHVLIPPKGHTPLQKHGVEQSSSVKQSCPTNGPPRHRSPTITEHLPSHRLLLLQFTIPTVLNSHTPPVKQTAAKSISSLGNIKSEQFPLVKVNDVSVFKLEQVSFNIPAYEVQVEST